MPTNPTDEDVKRAQLNMLENLHQISNNASPWSPFGEFTLSLMDDFGFAHEVLSLIAAGIQSDSEAASKAMDSVVKSIKAEFLKDSEQFNYELKKVLSENLSSCHLSLLSTFVFYGETKLH